MSVKVVSSAADRRLLDERKSTRAMTWIMAIMLFLTVLAAALGLATINAGARLDRQLAGRLTVQVVEPNAAARDVAAAKVLRTLQMLPSVASAKAVDRAQVAKLLKPWLGDTGDDADVPLPALIDVDLVTPDEEANARVAEAVRAAAPQARVDSQERWLSPVADFMKTIVVAALALVLLIAGATTAVVLLAARAGLEAHRDTIAVLHMLGSTDVQVARLFQRRIALDTLIGGAIGTVAAMLAVWMLMGQLLGMGSELVGGAALATRDWLLLALLPILFALVATVAARMAVLRRLRQVQ
jgi:cell division transport system permease protein